MVTDDKEQPVESHRLFELGEYVRMKTNDLTQGSIGKGFVLFAIPLFLGSLFQQLYNTVDMLFVGNVLGKNAAAAVGASCGRTNPYGDRCDLFPSSISQASHAS